MKYSMLFSWLSLMIFFGSCTKEESLKNEDGFIKIIDSVAMDSNIGSVQLDDGNFLVVCRGQIIKLNNSGKIIWKKNVSPLSLISIPGTGFASVDFIMSSTIINISVYDNDGNFLFVKGFNSDSPYGSGFAEFIRLSNGNYAYATYSSFTWCGYLKIFDPDFNLLYSKAYCASGNYNDLTIQRICETPDGGVAMTVSLGSSGQYSHFINSGLIIAGPTGNIKSNTISGDTLINETSTEVSSYSNGYFAVTSRMIGWETGNGAFVSYYGGSLIAGKIGIDRFSPDGQFTGRTELNDYPGFGLINSIRKTPDGGYILCGTVNNLGSAIAVSKTKIYLCKIDANLNKQWSKIIPTIYQTIGVDAVPTSDGGYQVTGNTKSFDIHDKMILIKTDGDGDF